MNAAVEYDAVFSQPAANPMAEPRVEYDEPAPAYRDLDPVREYGDGPPAA